MSRAAASAVTPTDAGPLSDGATAAKDSGALSPDAAPVSDTVTQVVVKNIGMHIGGGPNDADTKRPIRKAIEPHFAKFAACYRYVKEQKKGGTFGVDIRIGREGGRADIRKPRPGMKGEGLEDCILKVFESIEFPKPSTRAPMVVSYSLSFKPKKSK